jgi:hypothetical protein
MPRDNRKDRNSRVTNPTHSEIYAQRREFGPTSLIFSPFRFCKLQEYINNKFGITTMTSVPEYKLTAYYPPQERNNIRERHCIDGNFVVVSFGNFDDRDAALEAAKQEEWNVQIFLHKGERRAVRATEKTGQENFLEMVSGPKKPNSNSANTSTDPDVKMTDFWSIVGSNINRRNARCTVQKNSNTNTTSQLDQDVVMQDVNLPNGEPILRNFINTTPFATTVTSFEVEILCVQFRPLSI